jgi:hypothetical protein
MNAEPLTLATPTFGPLKPRLGGQVSRQLRVGSNAC